MSQRRRRQQGRWHDGERLELDSVKSCPTGWRRRSFGLKGEHRLSGFSLGNLGRAFEESPPDRPLTN